MPRHYVGTVQRWQVPTIEHAVGGSHHPSVDASNGPKKKRKGIDPTPETKAFGERLEARKNERGLSLRALAAVANISPGDLSRMQKGEQVPGLEAASKLARVLDCSLEWLWEGRGAPGAAVPVAEPLEEALDGRSFLPVTVMQARARASSWTSLQTVAAWLEYLRNLETANRMADFEESQRRPATVTPIRRQVDDEEPEILAAADGNAPEVAPAELADVRKVTPSPIERLAPTSPRAGASDDGPPPQGPGSIGGGRSKAR